MNPALPTGNPALSPTSEHSAPRPGPVLNACWNHLGVWGDRQCAELSRFVHCRNCPVYSAAAVQMLDSELPRDYLQNWTRHFSQVKEEVAAHNEAVIIFRVAAEWLALPVGVLVEVVGRRRIHSLPRARSRFIKGLVTIRGQLLVCVSFTRLLNLGERTAEERARHKAWERLLVVSSPGGRLVIPVSEVFSLTRYLLSDLHNVPATVLRSETHFTRGIFPHEIVRHDETGVKSEHVHVGLLDPEPLFQHIDRHLT